MDEIIRAHGLTPGMRSKITCPKEVMFGPEGESTCEDSPDGNGEPEEHTLKLAQRIAGECLWLAQRTRVDIAFTTSMMCSLVAADPQKAVAIGRRLLMYLAQTKGYKLRMKAVPDAPILRIYTDASFAPEGRNSYGGHILEFRKTPVVWRAGKQQLIAMSSAETELIQVVEGSTYGESFIALIRDLGIRCVGAQVDVDNTAAISLVRGGCSQRTRHLKVRGAKLNQLLQEGWTLGHCQGLYQKADILTKPLPSARLKFLCELLGLGPTEVGQPAEPPRVHTVQGFGKVFKVCLVGLLTSLQGVVCKGDDSKPALEVEWPWELMLAVLLIVLSTVCVWETLRNRVTSNPAPSTPSLPQVRAVAATKEGKAKKLQDRVAAAIESVVSESSPSGSEPKPHRRKSRNKCPRSPEPSERVEERPTVYGGVNIHLAHSPADPQVDAYIAHRLVYGEPTSSSSSLPPGLPNPQFEPVRPPPEAFTMPVAQAMSSQYTGLVRGEGSSFGPSQARTTTQITQTDPVVILTPDSSVYSSAGGHCIHCEIGCRGLRNAGHIHAKSVCQYCLRKAGPRAGF